MGLTAEPGKTWSPFAEYMEGLQFAVNPGFSPCHHLCEERILASPQLSGLGLGGPRKGHPAVGLWYNALKVHLPPKQIF